MLNAQSERFVELLLIGKPDHVAYAEVYGMKSDETVDSPTLRSRARGKAHDPHVMRRLAELRAPVIQQATRRFAFDLDMALEGAQRAHDVAELIMDPANMLKAIELQAKLCKLLGSEGARPSTVLDSASTEDLVLLLKELKSRRDCDVLIEQVAEGLEAGAPGPVEDAELCDGDRGAGSTAAGGAGVLVDCQDLI